MLLDIYTEYGLFREKLVNVVRKGAYCAAEIKKMMEDFRNNPPSVIGGSEVVKIDDYLLLTSMDMHSGKKSPLHLEKSNVLQFFLDDGSRFLSGPQEQNRKSSSTSVPVHR